MQQYYIVFYSHVNYSVTKIILRAYSLNRMFYSHVNYSVTKIIKCGSLFPLTFYSHVNYSVTKIESLHSDINRGFTVT